MKFKDEHRFLTIDGAQLKTLRECLLVRMEIPCNMINVGCMMEYMNYAENTGRTPGKKF